MKEKRTINLSKEELAQLKGGEKFAGNLPQMESTNPNILKSATIIQYTIKGRFMSR